MSYRRHLVLNSDSVLVGSFKKDNNLNRKKAAVQEASPKSIKYVKPRTKGQSEYIRTIAENDITICHGFAGTGKSAIATIMACQYYAEGKVDKILITRPIIAASTKSIGALPGDIKEKVDPYLTPLVEEIEKYFGRMKASALFRDEVIEMGPLELMRGRTFDRCFMILDEAQNCTKKQIKMFLTRIGEDSKIVVNGDDDQSDIPEGPEALMDAIDKLTGVSGVGIAYLGVGDIVRNEMVKRILGALR